jgi:hypothetical protein
MEGLLPSFRAGSDKAYRRRRQTMFDEYEQKQHEQAYRQGYQEGKNGGFLDDVFHDLGQIITTVAPETTEHQSHERGYEDGRKAR